MSTPTPVRPDRPSRIVHLDGGQSRQTHQNKTTLFIRPGQATVKPAEVPFHALFLAHYRAIREMGRQHDLGVAIFAFHLPTSRLAGRAWIRAEAGRINTAIVGRHSHADLLLVDDPALSLRHLTIVLHPLESWEHDRVRYSVLDLRTGLALRDERDHPLDALCAEGPALLRCGDHALFLFQTGDPSSFPPLAADAWELLPERVYFDEHDAEPDRWQRRALRRPAASRRRKPVRESHITLLPGPMGMNDVLVASGEQPLGDLMVMSATGARRIPIGSIAARRGVILGRYERCELADLLGDQAISRTHLMLLEVAGRLWWIDVGSMEGTFVASETRGPRAIRHAAVEDAHDRILIGQSRATVVWIAAHDGG